MPLTFLFAAVQVPAPPSFDSQASLESFVLSGDDGQISQSLAAALDLDGAGNLVQAAVRMGPAQASQVAAMLADPGYRQGYRDVARYLDLFGPCQKQEQPKSEGWWANYPDPPSEHHCGEAAKLLFSALLWNQVHYCSRLASGAEKSRQPVPSGKEPPYRLDEPPVATRWLHSAALYALADAALRFDLARTLRAQSATVPDRVREAMLAAADELQRPTPSREQAALALAKLLIRRYEQSHLGHLARPAASGSKSPG